MEVKKISPSQIVKFLFPDVYKDIPEWILEKAAEFGKDLHESIQTYIEQPDLDDEITEALITDNKIRLYEAFKQWFTEQEIKEPRTEYYLETDTLHGYLDLVDFETKTFYDYKFRNVDKKLDLTKDVIQMLCYEIILIDLYKEGFNWELIIFDKKTAKIFTLSRNRIDKDWLHETVQVIKLVIETLLNKQEIENYKLTKDDLEQWEPEIITELKYQAYLKDGDPGDR